MPASPTMTQRSLLLPAFLLAASCAPTHRAFRPTEHVEGETIEGYKEAFYDLTAGGDRVGVVKVWSRGAFRKERGGTTATDLHVGFDIEALGDRDLRLDPSEVELETVWLKERTLKNISKPEHSGSLVAPANRTTTAELTFTLPPPVKVTDVGAFRVHWAVNANGRKFVEFTPFVQQKRTYAYVPVFAYYNPYCVPGWPCFASPLYYGWPVVIVRHYPRRIVVFGRHRARPARPRR